MTKFILKPSKIQVNALSINRNNFVVTLRSIYRQFPPPNTFRIKDIQNVEYSDKTIRAIIFVALQYKYLETVSKKGEKPTIYCFSNYSIDEIIQSFSLIEP